MTKYTKFVIFALMLLLAGCAVRSASFEREAFSSMMAAQAAIEEGRRAIEAGELPASLTDPFNLFVASYNEARAAVLAWRASRDADGQDAVERALDALGDAWLAWTAARAEVPE